MLHEGHSQKIWDNLAADQADPVATCRQQTTREIWLRAVLRQRSSARVDADHYGDVTEGFRLRGRGGRQWNTMLQDTDRSR